VAKDTALKTIVKLLKETKGVYGISTGKHKKHPFVSWSLSGRRFTYTCAGTASDPRTVGNCLAGVKRLIKVACQVREQGESSSKKSTPTKKS
jgi:hypothetical protein